MAKQKVQSVTAPSTVYLIGRTNVGKSSLFNRLIEKQQALISKIPGTTRDKNVGICHWGRHSFGIVDTGGLDLSKPDEIDQKATSKVWKELDNAGLVLLIVDAKQGLVPADKTIAKELYERQIPFIIAANKADSPKLRQNISEFYRLHDTIFPVSAANGSGTGDLLDYLVEHLPKESFLTEISLKQFEKPISIAFAGIPNVGKSSLVNALLGREEVIVSDQPHTTRESRDLFINYKDQLLRLIDTAGLRKARKLKTSLIKSSADRSLKAIEESDWVIFTIDATQNQWGEQEKYILQRIIKSGSSVVIAANKWDLLESKDRYKEFMNRWQRSFASYSWIPIISISAKTGWHVHKLLDTILKYHPQRLETIPQSGLDRVLKKAIKIRRPQKKKGPEAPYIHAIKQVSTAPPTFEIVIDYKDTLAESYIRFLQKQLREKFDFTGTPIRLYVRSIK